VRQPRVAPVIRAIRLLAIAGLLISVGLLVDSFLPGGPVMPGATAPLTIVLAIVGWVPALTWIVSRRKDSTPLLGPWAAVFGRLPRRTRVAAAMALSVFAITWLTALAAPFGQDPRYSERFTASIVAALDLISALTLTARLTDDSGHQP
jgi:hypothetical protein